MQKVKRKQSPQSIKLDRPSMKISKPIKISYFKNINNIIDPSTNTKQTQQKRSQTKRETAFGFQRANYQLALENVKTKSNRFYKGQKVSFLVERQHFKIYGPGIYLFFQFLWKLSILFFVLSLISLIPIIYNYFSGTRFSEARSSLDIYLSKISISNFYGDDPNQQFQEKLAASSKAKLLNCITDLVCCFLIMIFYFYWTNSSSKRTEEIKKSFKLANYFTLELTEFPQSTTDQDVYKFFSNFGTVTQVAPVKNYSQTIQLSKQIYELQVDLKKMKIQKQNDKELCYDKEIKQIQKKIEKLYTQLAEEQKKINGDVVKYYVSFETTAQKSETLKKFQKVYSGCCVRWAKIPQEFLLKGQRVEIQNCHVQPGQILWQNVHITWKTRWIRAIIQFLLLLIFIVLGFFIISTLNILTPPSSSDSIDTSNYTSLTILAQSDILVVESWCLKNTDLAYSTTSLTSLCDVYIKRYYYNLAITYSITVVIVIVKILLKNLVIFIAKFQRYKEHSEQSVDIIKNLVIIYIITTVIIGFLLQAQLFGIKFKNLIFAFVKNKVLQDNASKLEDFSELTNNWYVGIGYKIWFTWLVLAFSPHLYMPIYHYIMECLRNKLGQSQILQKDMQKVLQAEQFPIQDNYANIIMIFLVGLAFSGGIPSMLILSFIAIITRYLYFKHHFIRFCRVPNTIDEVLNDTVLSYFPWALGFHFVMTIWMYSVQSVFTHEKSFLEEWLANSSSSLVVLFQEIIKRITTSSYYSVVAAVFMIVILFKEIIYDFFIKCCKNEDNIENLEMEDTIKQIIKQNLEIKSQRSITNSYRIENNPNYFEILSIKQKMAKRFENSTSSLMQDQKKHLKN